MRVTGYKSANTDVGLQVNLYRLSNVLAWSYLVLYHWQLDYMINIICTKNTDT